jgi:hypothetical protein
MLTAVPYDHSLFSKKVFESKALEGTHRRKRDEVNEQYRASNNEEHCHLWAHVSTLLLKLLNIGHTGWTFSMEVYRILMKNVLERGHLEDRNGDGRVGFWHQQCSAFRFCSQ